MSDENGSLLDALEPLDLTPAQIADLIGVTARTAKRWTEGDQTPNKGNRAKIEANRPPPPLGSRVMQAMARSPAHAFTASRYLNPDYVEDNKPAYSLGTIAHRFILERQFEQDPRVTIFDFPDWRGNVPKVVKKISKSEVRKATYDAGRIPILRHQYDEALAMSKAVIEQLPDWPMVANLGNPKHGKAEVPLAWAVRDGVNNRPVICRCRLDWVEERGLLVDLKTTGDTAEPEPWSKRWLWWDVAQQMAFYTLGLAVTRQGQTFDPFILVVERKPPYAMSVIEVSSAALNTAHSMVMRAIQGYREAWESGEWPAYPREKHLAMPPGWKLDEAEQKGYAPRETLL